MFEPNTFTDLASYYQWLFPANPTQIDFIQSACPEDAPNSFIDIAAGTGQQLEALQNLNLCAHGLELDRAMAKVFHDRCPDRKGTLVVGDMKKSDIFLKEVSPAGLLYCIGNSLVQLDSLKSIQTALLAFDKLISPKGALLIQTVNFKGTEKLPTLPLIERQCPNGDTLKFNRSYEATTSPEHIAFHTSLLVNDQCIKKHHDLYKLSKESLSEELSHIGWGQQQWFGDYKYTPWTDQSSANIVLARRS